MSAESLDLVKALLQRNPAIRLADAKVVKQHPFLRSVDWERLLAKEVPPPYVPPVTSKEDTRMISHEFLDLKLDDLNAAEDQIPEAMQKKFEVFNS
jgi:serum/glucocorticoid-regulated kinase 2